MKSRKHFTLLGCVMLVVLIVFAGCSEESAGSEEDMDNLNKTGFPITEGEVNLDFVAPSSTTPDWNDVLVYNEYEKMTNMKIDWQMISDDGLKEKTNLMLSSGDYPDAFHSSGLQAQEISKYGKQGILIPLDDLIDEYAPNFKKILDEYPSVKSGLTMPDGKIYSFPRIFDPEFKSVLSGWKLWINDDFLDEVGMEEPETLDEFYEYLKAVKEENPTGNGKSDEIPLQLNEDGNFINILAGSYGLKNRGSMNKYVDMDPDTDELRFIATDPKYKEMLEYIHKLYDEKLINQDMYTVKPEQSQAKGQEGLFGATVTTSPESGYDQDNYIGALTLEGPHGDAIYSNVKDPSVNIGGFVITDKNPNPAATVRWIDYFYGDEGSKLFFMGIEGETYEEKEDGSVEYTDLIEDNPDGLDYTEAISKYLTWRSGGYPAIVKSDYFKGSEGLESSIEAADKFQSNVPEEVWPTFTFKEEEDEIIRSVGVDIEDYVTEMDAKFITGKASFDEWDDYVNTIEKMGLDQYMEAYESSYERYVEEK